MSAATSQTDISGDVDGVERDYPVVYLSEDDIAEAYRIAGERNDSKDGRGYLDADQDSFTAHFRGIQGELALAKWYGVEDSLDTGIHADGDDGVDLTIAGFAVDAKTTPHDSYGRLLMDVDHVYRALDEEDKRLPDTFYLCEIIETGVVGLVGWCTLGELLDREPRKWPRNRQNYVVQRRELRDIHDRRGDAQTAPCKTEFDSSFTNASVLAD